MPLTIILPYVGSPSANPYTSDRFSTAQSGETELVSGWAFLRTLSGAHMGAARVLLFPALFWSAFMPAVLSCGCHCQGKVKTEHLGISFIWFMAKWSLRSSSSWTVLLALLCKRPCFSLPHGLCCQCSSPLSVQLPKHNFILLKQQSGPSLIRP